MAVKSHNWSGQIWVPDKNVQIEATRNDDLVLLRVSHFSDSTLVTLESLDGSDGEVVEDVLLVVVALEVLLDLVGLSLVLGLLTGISGVHGRLHSLVNLFLAQIP